MPYVDRAAMSAKATISTATIDRTNDLLVPKGCWTVNYEKNPMVLFDHGIGTIAMPMGLSQDREKNLTVEITDDEVNATCFFTQSILEPCQIFELVAEGTIKATSVRETPRKSRMVLIDGQQVCYVDEWELEEWSWCLLGVNPDAVAKTIDRNRLGGKPIVPSIMKSLTSAMPEKPATEFVQIEVSKLQNTEKKSMAGEKPEDEKDNEKDPSGRNTSTPAEDVKEDQDPATMPYGQQVLRAHHAEMSKCIKKAEDCVPVIEQPDVKKCMMKSVSSLKDELTNIEGAHNESYPLSKPLGPGDEKAKDDDGGGEGEDDSDSEMKSYLAAGMAGFQVSGLSVRLKSLLSDKNLTKPQRQLIKDSCDHLSRLCSQAKSMKSEQRSKTVAEKTTDTPKELADRLAKLSAS